MVAQNEFDYGKIDLARASSLEERMRARWQTAHEVEYFARHPIARARRFLGSKVEVPPLAHSPTIYEGRRGALSVFIARASGEVTGSVWQRTRYFEFERLVDTRYEAYDLFFQDDYTVRLPSENSLRLFCSEAARRIATINKTSVEQWAQSYVRFCEKSRGERVGAIAGRICEHWRHFTSDPVLWPLEAEKTDVATELVMSSVCSLVAHYHVAFGGADFSSDDWTLVVAKLFPNSTLHELTARVRDFQKFAHALSNLDNALETTKCSLSKSLAKLAPVTPETTKELGQLLERAYWHGRWLEPERRRSHLT